jgi:hypothetical protein
MAKRSSTNQADGQRKTALGAEIQTNSIAKSLCGI